MMEIQDYKIDIKAVGFSVIKELQDSLIANGQTVFDCGNLACDYSTYYYDPVGGMWSRSYIQAPNISAEEFLSMFTKASLLFEL